ncbi:MAG: glycosyltransferase family 2 protein [Actinomycetota bacterium]|nr:glycosyltransferase family 2 protein [Actinomycetota bacterium]
MAEPGVERQPAGIRLDEPVSAVVVNYNAGDALLRTVTSLSRQALSEIIVVDNASTDGSTEAVAAAVPGVRVVATGSNPGFGGGVNRGVAMTSALLVLVCNADLVVHPGAVDRLRLRLVEDPSVALVGPSLSDEGGVPSTSARAFPSLRRSSAQAFSGLLRPSGRMARRYAESNTRHREGRYVDWVTGACFLVRRDAFDEVGGFDEAYFMYVEEVDLCWRLRQAGWRVASESGARVTHTGGASSQATPYRLILAHHHSLWRFAVRSTKGVDRLGLPLVALGLVFRCAMTCVVRAGRAMRGAVSVPAGRPRSEVCDR